MSTRGSFLFICLALMAIMVVLAVTVLHDVRTQVDTSVTNQRYMLAQAAARSGFDHATENILADYNAATITLRSGTGPVTMPALTYLDGGYRAPFTSISQPNTSNSSWTDWNSATSESDVAAEDFVLRPWAWWWFEVGDWWGNTLMYDGRGRYYEPGFYNETINPPGSTTPVNPVLFRNLNPAPPERTDAVFYDDQFRRIPPSGNPVADRAAARYRLRYSVGVEDLCGHLLLNPMPDMNILASGMVQPDYRFPGTRYPWMPSAINALGAMAGSVQGPFWGGQLEHVFQGRGWFTNVDFDHSPVGITGWPKTFPLMYRNHPDAQISTNTTTGQQTVTAWDGSGCWGDWHDGVDNNSGLTTSLFWFSTGVPKGLATGGEVIPTWAWNTGANFWPYVDGGGPGIISHCLMGPQLSFDTATYAIDGERAYLNSPDWDKFELTPFGHRETATGYAPGAATNKWYQGPIDTPFHINVLTCPPATVDCMILGYLPPREKIFKYTSVVWYQYTGLDGNGNRMYQPLLQNVPIDGTNPINQGGAYGRDLLCDTTAPPAFSRWLAQERNDTNPYGANNPPGATGMGQVVKPDYYANDVRDPTLCYPGPFMNGVPGTAGQGGDDLGLNMDELNLGGGMDMYDKQGYVGLSAGWPFHWASDFNQNVGQASAWATTAAPPGWGTSPYDYLQKAPDPHQVLHTYSYYFDLMPALANAISVMRAQYIQYNLPWYPATQLFNPGDLNPQNYRTVRDLDRLFLAEMGESLDHPGTGSPATLKQQGNLNALQETYGWMGFNQPQFLSNYVPKNNILSLYQGGLLHTPDNTVSDLQRAHVMCLLLNDWRMSFLGSCGDYANFIDPATGQHVAANDFMPLDFLGEGRAYCSCYDPTLGGMQDVDHMPYALPGTKPPMYFSITGNFWLGKSHYYRVFSRGEVWDNLMNQKIDDATLDSVLAVDPEGNNPLQTQTLYQRWFFNRYQGELPHIRR